MHIALHCITLRTRSCELHGCALLALRGLFGVRFSCFIFFSI